MGESLVAPEHPFYQILPSIRNARYGVDSVQDSVQENHWLNYRMIRDVRLTRENPCSIR